MDNRVIDLTQFVLPNAHTQVYNGIGENNNFVGYIVDTEGNILDNSMELANETPGYFLIYKGKDDNDDHYVPDYNVEKPINILRIKLNTTNKEIAKKIMKFVQTVMSPWTFFLKLFMKTKKKEMIKMGHISTWQITSAVTFTDEYTGTKVPVSKIKLMTIDYKIEDKQANFGNIMLDY
jgi:hypothetical protein